jgi:multidrug efflux pump subunit AcrA (membrane-fusion protein)
VSVWPSWIRRRRASVRDMFQSRMPFALFLICLWAAMSLVSCGVPSEIRTASESIPVAAVRRADLQLHVNATGELRSTRTAMLVAPPIAGGTLLIIHLLRTGTQVKVGDPIIEFDPSQQQYNLEQNRSDYEQAEQEIVKAKDDAAVQAAQDQTLLLKAHFAVRQAQLEVSKNELVSAIDAQKNLLALDEAQRALEQLQQDIQSHSASGQATIAVDEEKSNKARLAMQQAEENIKNMRVLSPINGLVVVRENENAMGGIYFGGMSLPEFQEGDQVNPGTIVADVIDIDQMEIAAKISEGDRINVHTGQTVEIQADALPGQTFQGTVKNIAGAAGGFFDSDSGHKSEVTVQLDHPDGQLRPGFTAHLVIFGEHLAKALAIPREAVFEKDGLPTVYVKIGSQFEPRTVEIQYLTDGLAVISGLSEGIEVALVNPEQNPGGTVKPVSIAAPGPATGTP